MLDIVLQIFTVFRITCFSLFVIPFNVLCSSGRNTELVIFLNIVVILLNIQISMFLIIHSFCSLCICHLFGRLI